VVELTKKEEYLTFTLDLPPLLRPPYFRREVRKTAILQKRAVLVLSLRGEPCSALCDEGDEAASLGMLVSIISHTDNSFSVHFNSR
jgi:hypothetical protein